MFRMTDEKGSAERQSRPVPAASTIVNASTASTTQARNTEGGVIDDAVGDGAVEYAGARVPRTPPVALPLECGRARGPRRAVWDDTARTRCTLAP
jgi:hypothetical protein